MPFSSSSHRIGGPAGSSPHAPQGGFAREHRDGLVRGLVFAAALALPLGLTLGFAPAEVAGAGTPPQQGAAHRLALR